MSNQLTLQSFKQELYDNYSKQLLNYFSKDETKLNKFLSWVTYSIQKTPHLLTCDKQSLFLAVMDLAQLWIAPSVTQESYILPFNWKATAMIGYQWFVTLMYNAGISSVYAEIVRENDEFKILSWSDPKLTHKINPRHSKAERGDEIGCYVVVKVNWESIHKYMNIKDIYEFRDNYSQSYKSEKSRSYSPWIYKNDPEWNMKKKTVFKQMIKYLPKNEMLAKAIEVDNKEAPVNPQHEMQTGWDNALAELKEAQEKKEK